MNNNVGFFLNNLRRRIFKADTPFGSNHVVEVKASTGKRHNIHIKVLINAPEVLHDLFLDDRWKGLEMVTTLFEGDMFLSEVPLQPEGDLIVEDIAC